MEKIRTCGALAVTIQIVLLIGTFGCRGKSSEVPSIPTHPTVPVTATSTPDPALPFVFDLKTFAHIYNINGTGRVPLGLLNEVSIDRADARFKGFYVSENLPQDMFLYLSIITTPRDDFEPPNAPSYEWWFTTTDASDEQQLSPDRLAQLRIGLRYVGGGWGIYVDRGSGWERVPAGDFNFGQYEVSAKVRVDESWGISQIRSTYFRALTRDEDGVIAGITGVGDVYPRSLTWQHVLRY